jgi:hypothetical protein
LERVRAQPWLHPHRPAVGRKSASWGDRPGPGCGRNRRTQASRRRRQTAGAVRGRWDSGPARPQARPLPGAEALPLHGPRVRAGGKGAGASVPSGCRAGDRRESRDAWAVSGPHRPAGLAGTSGCRVDVGCLRLRRPAFLGGAAHDPALLQAAAPRRAQLPGRDFGGLPNASAARWRRSAGSRVWASPAVSRCPSSLPCARSCWRASRDEAQSVRDGEDIAEEELHRHAVRRALTRAQHSIHLSDLEAVIIGA